MTGRRLLLVNAEGAAVAAGGAETIVATLARGLAERGWEISVLAAFPTADPLELGSLTTLHSTSWRTSQRRRVLNHVGDLVASAPQPNVPFPGWMDEERAADALADSAKTRLFARGWFRR
jgi:hypothetical protein